MRKIECIRWLYLLLTAIIFMAVSTIPTLAAEYYQSDESGEATPPASIDSITVSSEEVEIPADSLDSFFDLLFSSLFGSETLTPAGNMTLVDDILESDDYFSVENEQQTRQFITVQTRNGNYFYIIIDRSGDSENVYFLNLVDEADLLALIDDDVEEPEPTALICTCQDKCYTGHVDTSCALCAVNLTACQGKEPVRETTSPEPSPEVGEETQSKSNAKGMIAVILVLAIAGGAAFYFLKIKGGTKPQTKGHDKLDEYDYGEDDEEYEAETEDEQNE